MASIDNVQDITPRIQYVAAAAQVNFGYPFPIFEETDLVVDIDGVAQVLTTDYTVEGEGDDSGGFISIIREIGDELVGGEIVTIYRDTSISRVTDFQQGGPFASASFNDELDRVTLWCQDLENKIGRTIRFPQIATATNTQAEMSPISTFFGKFLRISAGGILEAAEVTDSVVTLTAEVIGALLHPRSNEEITAGFTPTAYRYDYGNVLRAGAVGTTGTDSSQAAFANIVAAAKDGDTIKIPTLPSGEFFYLTAEISTNNKWLTIDARGAHTKWDVATANENIFSTGTGGIQIVGGKWEGTRTTGGDNELYGYVAQGTGVAYATPGRSMIMRDAELVGLAGPFQAKWMRLCRVETTTFETMVTDGNGVFGYYQACRVIICDQLVQKDTTGTYSLLTNNDGAANLNDVVVARDCEATVYPSIRYARRVTFHGGKYHIANGDAFSGAILLSNVADYIELISIDARGAHGNTNTGGVLRVSDSAGHIKVVGGTYRSYSGIGHGLHFNGIADDSYIEIIGPVVIDETGTNVNNGVFFEPASDGRTYHGQVIATIDGFTNGFACFPRVNGLTVMVKTINSAARGIYANASSAGIAKLQFIGCDCDHKIEVNNCEDVEILGGRGTVVQFSNAAHRCKVADMKLGMRGTTDPTVSMEGDDCVADGVTCESDGTGSTGGVIHFNLIGDDGSVQNCRSRGLSQTNAWGISCGASAVRSKVSGNKVDGAWGGFRTIAGSSYVTPGDNFITGEGAGGATSHAGTDLSGADLF